MTLANNRLVKTFAELRAAGRQTLLPFITAGYPSIEATEALLRKFDALGVRMCELGIPFSDPIADGPVIQASYTDALTGLMNRRFLSDQIDTDVAAVARSYTEDAASSSGDPHRDLLFMMLDLDGLKGINDTYEASISISK